MSVWVPIRWGVVEAVRAVGWGRLTVAVACAFSPLFAFEVDPSWVGLSPVLMTLGVGMLLGLAAPSGSAMLDARSWAGWAGGLTHALLAGALLALAYPIATQALSRPGHAVFQAHEFLVCLGATWSTALVAAALRQRYPWHPAAVTFMTLLVLVGLSLGAVELVPLSVGWRPVDRLFESLFGAVLVASFALHALLCFVPRVASR
jgi:ABC-type Mn2+/Zn2+ transport system permease subunit